MAKVSSGRRVRGGCVGLVLWAAVGVLGGWGATPGQAFAAQVEAPKADGKNAQQDGAKTAAQPITPPPFGLESAAGEPRNETAAIVLHFNRPLASVQSFNELIYVKGDNDRGLYGAWNLSDNGKTLFLSNVTPKGTYEVTIKTGLLAADGTSLAAQVTRQVNAGELPAVLTFASSGSVLPARGSLGLPVVSTNVQDAEIEFFRVRDESLSTLFCLYPNNKPRSAYALMRNSYSTCAKRNAPGSISDIATSVYANHYTLPGKADVRTTTYVPIQNVPQLSEPGVYMAVMRQGGSFSDTYATAVFFVSDLGMHVRLYAESALLHVASLQDGKPLEGVKVSLDDAGGTNLFSGTTDKDGNLVVSRKIDPNDVLIARRGKEVSVLPFNRPALDVSNFDIAGRAQAPVEVFAWSGRDLYRPGETPRVSALLRDYDGKALPAQPLFARLVQPDGRKLADVRLEAKDLNQFEWSQIIANDAPTGSWQLEFRLDPASAEAVRVFNFNVEEFLPERLKVDLSSTQQYVRPDETLNFKVQSSYLYGSPAAGNRFTAKLVAKAEVHPLPTMPDTFFGDPFVKVAANDEVAIDNPLAEDGSLEREIVLPSDVKPVTPYALVVSGSVYETGGRAVSRVLTRVYWPANELVGVRPLFDPKQGAHWSDQAGFEIVRANSAGEKVAGKHLKVRLLQENRYSYWFREQGDEWKAQDDADLELIEEREVDVPAGRPLAVNFPVQWGSYRLEVFDPQTNLTTKFPFYAGYSWDDENAGKEARPDKVKVALDKPGYRAGDTLKVTVTPPQEGPGLLLVESDHLLYSTPIFAKAGATFDVPVTADWEREDVHVVVLVFRGGMAKDLSTPARALGIEHVTMERTDRRIALKLTAPTLVRPLEPLEVTVQAEGLAGQKAYVRLTAVDQGVLNITDYPVPDAWTWMFSKRAMGVDPYDLYGRLIEAVEGATARLRYGGDLVGNPLPKATRLNPRVLITDLLATPVQFDAQGKAVVRLDVPDFNGSLRVSALAYGEQRYGNASADVTVRAPLLVEPSMPRVMTGGDQAQISLDVKNFSGQSGLAKITVRGSGLIDVANSEQSVMLEDGAGTTLHMPVTAQAGVDVAKVDIQAKINDFTVQRHFEFAVRSGWPQTVRSVPMTLEGKQEQLLDVAQAEGLFPATVNSELTLSTLPPLPYRQALQGVRYYPYGCIEQTTSGGYAALFMDEKTTQGLGINDYPESLRHDVVTQALARVASFQASNGHFTFWGGNSSITPYMTPYVVDFILDARDAGFAVPEKTLQNALEVLNNELLSGGEPYYDYEYREHLSFANQAYSAFVLARVNRAPLGTLRSLFDNRRQRLVSPLPLVHLGIALKLMGDNERAQKALTEAFEWTKERPWYVGDYGSELRDLGVMVALSHTYGVNTPVFDGKLVNWARGAASRVNGAPEDSYYYGWNWSYLSTQERIAIARVLHTFNSNGAPLAVTLDIGGQSEAAPANTYLWTRQLTSAQINSGVRVKPQTDAVVFASFDTAGISETPPAPDASRLSIARTYFTTDGKPWNGDTLKEGDSLIVQLTINASITVADAMVTDLLPGGLEVENLNLSGAQAWADVVVDGVEMKSYDRQAQIVHEEYRDDRYAAAVKLLGGDTARLFYLVRAVTPGTYSVPPPIVEDMYRPAVRGIGSTNLKTVTVGTP